VTQSLNSEQQQHCATGTKLRNRRENVRGPNSNTPETREKANRRVRKRLSEARPWQAKNHDQASESTKRVERSEAVENKGRIERSETVER
jgi:hypothetical protein